jgi:hypothetical protein
MQVGVRMDMFEFTSLTRLILTSHMKLKDRPWLQDKCNGWVLLQDGSHFQALRIITKRLVELQLGRAGLFQCRCLWTLQNEHLI